MSERVPVQPPAVCYRYHTGPEDLARIPRDDLVQMLFILNLVRHFENVVLDFKDNELVHGPAHTSNGQEAIAAAVSTVLEKGDMCASTHRAHGHFLSKALMYYAPDGYQPLATPLTDAMQDAVNRTLAEIMGLKMGWCGGRGGSMHLYDGASGNLGSNAIVGGGIPIATGAAWAQRLQNKDNVVVSFFGDGAINQGCFHEVANMAALWQAPVLYLVENNLYAVGTCTAESSHVIDLGQRTLGYGFDSLIVDGMDPVAMYWAVKDTVEQMRAKPGPALIEAKTYRHYHHAGRIPGSAFGYREKQEEAEWLKRDPINNFTAQLVTQGVVSEAEADQLQEMATQSMATAMDYCTVEQDGKRMVPAPHWPLGDSVREDVRGTGDELATLAYVEREDLANQPQTTMTYVEAIAGVTRRNMARDERVIVMGEEVANLRGGAYQATRGIKEAYPERIFNTPISETGFVGMGGGLASVGMRPVVEIMFPDFALMASDQLFNQIGKLRHMYGGQVSFPLILRTRVALGFGYGGQHSMDPAAFFAMFSGWRIMAPSNAFDYVGMFNTAMACPDPVLIMEHGLLYADKDQVPEGNLDYYVPYGKAKVLRQGSDVTVLTYLTNLAKCLEAADALAEEGLSAEVIDLRTLDYTGMDWETIGASLRKTGALMTVDQCPRSLSLSGRIADEAQERFFDYLDCPVGKVTAPDVPPAVSLALETALVPEVAQIKQAMAQGARHLF